MNDLTNAINPISDIQKFKAAWNCVGEEDQFVAAGHSSVPVQARFNPYSDEGGTTAAIAGDNFVVIASDTRLSANGFTIITRTGEKVHKLSDTVVLGTAGFYGDVTQLIKFMRVRMRVYQFNFNTEMTVDAVSELLSRTLYYKRFFPYYVANVLGGIDREGKGAVYSYDPVGTLERVPYSIHGSANSMMDPILDNMVGWKNQPEKNRPPLTIARAQGVLKDAFRSAAERDTSTGDFARVITLQFGQPMQEELIQLRND